MCEITIIEFAMQIGRKEQLESGKVGKKVTMKAKMWEGTGF
jgi:hypothetical protein